MSPAEELHLVGGGRGRCPVYGANEIAAAVVAVLCGVFLLNHLLERLHTMK